jgi:hypothetical protein
MLFAELIYDPRERKYDSVLIMRISVIPKNIIRNSVLIMCPHPPARRRVNCKY